MIIATISHYALALELVDDWFLDACDKTVDLHLTDTVYLMYLRVIRWAIVDCTSIEVLKVESWWVVLSKTAQYFV